MPRRRSPGACRRSARAPARWATSARTPSTSPSTSPARRSRRVSGIIETLVTERPLLGEGVGLSGTASTERGAVTVDDIALFTGRLESGALASFEATRFRTGRKNALRIEISGSLGAISFDLERLNELEFYDATLPETELGFRRILVTEHDHPYLAPWWPTGHMLGYEHGFSHQVYDFVTAIADGTQPLPVVRGRAARAARARRRRAQLRRRERLDADRRLTRTTRPSH